jgi:hypothetical protein
MPMIEEVESSRECERVFGKISWLSRSCSLCHHLVYLLG